MNLAALRDKIKNLSDYSPDLLQYNDQIDNLINDAYLSIWAKKRWTFATKQKDFPFHPDILPGRDKPVGGSDTVAAVVKGSRKVAFNQSINRLTEKAIWEGAIFAAEGIEYRISKVIDDVTILLVDAYLGVTSNTLSSWVIKKRYYHLPQDCIELLNLSHRDAPISSASGAGTFPPRGKLLGLLPRRDEDINLREDYKAAWSEAFVWSPQYFVPAAEKIGLTSTPIEGNTGFLQNTWLEVCWAFEKDGKLGALSQPATIKFTGNSTAFSLGINFLSWDDQPIIADAWQSKDLQPTQYEGLRKVVFWNANFNRATGERLGLPAWKHFNSGGSTRNTTTYLTPIKAEDTVSSITIGFLNTIDAGNERYIEIDGQHLSIRPYPRCDAWDRFIEEALATETYSAISRKYLRIGEMRYFFKPPLLAEATDSPMMPYEFHILICYKALEEIYLKLGNAQMSELYRRRITDATKDLERRYVDHIDSTIVRGRFLLGAPSGDSYAPYDWQSLRKVT
jgi:hypothetical protein